MKLLEIIEIRSAKESQAIIETITTEYLDALESTKNIYAVKIYKNRALSSDFGIHILRETTADNEVTHPLIERIITAFKEHGLVNYGKWIEITSNARPEGRE